MTDGVRPLPDAAVAILRRRFLNRTDCVAIQTERKTPRPVDVSGTLDVVLLGHVAGAAAPEAKVRFNGKNGPGAMLGRFRVGSYCPGTDNLTKWLCQDLDGAGHAEALADVDAAAAASLDAFAAAGIPAYLERSGGGHGWHVWAFFDPPIEAARAQALGRALAPKDAPLTGGGVADPFAGKGIEVFPKQAKIAKKGYGNLVWLPWWQGAPDGANLFWRRREGGSLEPYVPEDLAVAPPEAVERVLAVAAVQEEAERAAVPPPPEADAVVAAEGDWAAWREKALAALPLDAVYGHWLTGKSSGAGWLECRDPASPSGDQSPSAGVADGTGQAERGAFHSHISGETMSAFDFLVAHGGCSDFRAACARVAELSGVALPSPAAGAAKRPRRPAIQVNARSLDAVVGDAWRATHAANRRRPSLFRRGSLLVRLVRDERGVRIETLSEAGVVNQLSVVADWVRVTEQGDVRGFPNKEAARSMLDLPDAALPALDAIVATPVFAPDGSLVETPGHHVAARLWYEPPPGFKVPAVPERPTDEEVAAAKALLLEELLCDFPFVDAAARAHMVAALLLPFVRRLVRGPTPIHLFEAPAEGSGKNLLVNVVSVLVAGVAVTGGSIPEDEDEVRKKIGAELASGRPLLVLDNAETKKRLDSSAIASATTMWPDWTDRLLGHNKTFSVPNDALWVLTGNNPRLSREIARRCVSIRIDAKLDRPWLRTDFRHPDLLDWTTENRPRLVHAALVLVANWLARGRPVGTTRLGSFERWSDVLGGILAAAGIEGFLGNLEALYATADAEGSMWRAFVAAWWEEHGETPVRLAELIALCEKGELMAVVLGDGSPRSQSTRLGNALSTARDRVFGSCKIESAGRDGHTKAALYRLRPAAGGAAAAQGDAAPGAGAGAAAVVVPDFLPSLADFEESP